MKRTGEKAQFAGFDAERLTILASQSCRDKQTGSVCDVTLSLDRGSPRASMAASTHCRFQRAYAQKMGYDAAVSRDLAERAKTMFGRYQGVWAEIAKKTGDVQGYPVKTSSRIRGRWAAVPGRAGGAGKRCGFFRGGWRCRPDRRLDIQAQEG